MAEASKLFDQSGGGSHGGKQDAVNGAAMTITKLVVQSKFSSLTGGKNSGGLGGLAGLVRVEPSRTSNDANATLHGFRRQRFCNRGVKLYRSHTLYSGLRGSRLYVIGINVHLLNKMR